MADEPELPIWWHGGRRSPGSRRRSSRKAPPTNGHPPHEAHEDPAGDWAAVAAGNLGPDVAEPPDVTAAIAGDPAEALDRATVEDLEARDAEAEAAPTDLLGIVEAEARAAGFAGMTRPTDEELAVAAADALETRTNLAQQAAEAARPLTSPEAAMVERIEAAARDREAGIVVEASAEATWPDPPGGAAYHGLLGAIATAVAPRTEADPVGILATLLAMFGAACGGSRSLYQGSQQRPNLSILLVGETGFRGRKGTALDVGRAVFRLAYPELDGLWLVGVASGEAITGHFGRHQDEERAFLVEPEFGRVLTIMNREGSTLSAILRNAWDGVPLGHARARDESLVTHHHVALLGHVTPAELRAKLSAVDAENGFANRLLFVAVRRSQLIPFPTAPDDVVSPFVGALHRAIVDAQRSGELRFDDEARERWRAFYADLANEPRLGLAGAVTARHEAQVARLALVYALADNAGAIGLDHLEAAIAFADYARRSVVWAVGDSTGNRHADLVRRRLTDGPISWEQARELTGQKGADLEAAIAILVNAGLAEVVRVPREGGGRPRRIIRANGTNGAKVRGVAHT